MATITSLPDEVIDIILGYENVSIKDAVSFKSTCKQFHEMIHSKKFWEKKFYQRCPSARKKYNAEERKKIFNKLDFKEKVKTSVKCIKSLQYYVHLMSNINLLDTNKKELGHLLISIAEDSMTYYFVFDEINSIISPEIYPWNLDSNLANIYSFDRINYYLKQYRFMYKLNKFLNMPKEKQLFERLIIIMTQYCKPCVSYSVTETFLDDFAYEVLSLVKERYPKHSIFSTSPEQISFWRDNNIECNFWNQTEAIQIIQILQEFMSEHGVYKLNKLLTTLGIVCEFIINFLYHRKFLQTIIYQSVARRLGIYCCARYVPFYDINDYTWRPKYNIFSYSISNIEDMERAEYYFKERILNSFGSYKGLNDNARRYMETFYTSKSIQVIRKTMFYLDESLRHKNYVHPHYGTRSPVQNLISTINYWFREYNKIKEINIETQTEYHNITDSIEVRSDIVSEKQEKPKRRNREIKFATGMIVTHTSELSNISRDGVIIGWHLECNGYFEIKSSIIERSLKPYRFNKWTIYSSCGCTNDNYDRPHYIILTDSNEIRYVRQDAISKCSTSKRSKLINNVEIGRYFSRFESTHYVPLEFLAKEYPDDTAAIIEILSNQ